MATVKLNDPNALYNFQQKQLNNVHPQTTQMTFYLHRFESCSEMIVVFQSLRQTEGCVPNF